MTQDIILYSAVFLGVMMEGEVAILAATLAAQNNVLNIYLVALVAFTSTLVADWACFFTGRIAGTKILNRYEKIRHQSGKVEKWLSKYPTFIVILYRYLYGFRIITLIMMGMSNFPVKKYLPLSILSIALWTTIFTAGGYFLGELVASIFKNVENYFVYYVLGFIIGIVLILLIRKIIGKSLGKNSQEGE